MSQAHYYRCTAHENDYSNGVSTFCSGAIARWIFPDRVSVTLCKKALNYWCDFADDDPSLEPAGIEWLWDAGTRWCIVHDWPAELCSDWTHKRRTLDELGLRPVDLVGRAGSWRRRT